jgi:hypothetical protein
MFENKGVEEITDQSKKSFFCSVPTAPRKQTLKRASVKNTCLVTLSFFRTLEKWSGEVFADRVMHYRPVLFTVRVIYVHVETYLF